MKWYKHMMILTYCLICYILRILKNLPSWIKTTSKFYIYFDDEIFQIFHLLPAPWWYTAQKLKFSIKDFFSNCDQIRRKLRIWLHLLKKSLMENFIFCAVINKNTRFLSLKYLKRTYNFHPKRSSVLKMYRRKVYVTSPSTHILGKETRFFQF